MNILFIEDEKELAATGVAQLELKGYTVFPAYDLAEAKVVLEDPERQIHYVIADHRLPDGMGIEFVSKLKETSPRCKCAVVSGCLSEQDIQKLVERKIPYYHKPLLYGKVIDELRRTHAALAPEHMEPEPKEEATKTPTKEQKSGMRTFWPFK